MQGINYYLKGREYVPYTEVSISGSVKGISDCDFDSNSCEPLTVLTILNSSRKGGCYNSEATRAFESVVTRLRQRLLWQWPHLRLHHPPRPLVRPHYLDRTLIQSPSLVLNDNKIIYFEKETIPNY